MDDDDALTKPIDDTNERATPLTTATMLLVNWLIEHTKKPDQTAPSTQVQHDEQSSTPLRPKN